MATKAIYAGSFDPITNGHVHVIHEALALFDEVIVSVGTNPDKASKYMFDAAERADMIMQSFEDVPSHRMLTMRYDRQYLVHEAMRLECTHIVRGIRDSVDLRAEMTMATANRQIARTATGYVPSTVFIPTPPELAIVSSSFVKSLIGFDGWEKQISRYVPAYVYRQILSKVNDTPKR